MYFPLQYEVNLILIRIGQILLIRFHLIKHVSISVLYSNFNLLNSRLFKITVDEFSLGICSNLTLLYLKLSL